MSKPLGIGLGVSDGAVVMRVRPIDRVADEIYDAVREGICAGWTPHQFLAEVREAWAHELDEQKKQAMRELRDELAR